MSDIDVIETEKVIHELGIELPVDIHFDVNDPLAHFKWGRGDELECRGFATITADLSGHEIVLLPNATKCDCAVCTDPNHTLLHELAHAMQRERLVAQGVPLDRTPDVFMHEQWVHGYWKSKYEIEANEIAARLAARGVRVVNL